MCSDHAGAVETSQANLAKDSALLGAPLHGATSHRGRGAERFVENRTSQNLRG